MNQKVLVFGSEGMVGSRFVELNQDNFEIFTPLASEVDLLNKDQIQQTIDSISPSVIINFAAYTNVDKAEEEKYNKEGLVYKLNVECNGVIGQICKAKDIHFIYISTDYVFDGEKSDAPYREDDVVNPLSWYGETKYQGEKEVLGSGCRSIISRIQMPYRSEFPVKQDIVRFFLQQLKEGKPIIAINDQVVTPVFIDDLALALKVLIQKQEEGVFHIVDSGSTTPFDLAKMVASTFGLDVSLVSSTKFEDYNKTRAAKRPQYCWLDNNKFRKEFGEGILHDTEEGLRRFKQQLAKIY